MKYKLDSKIFASKVRSIKIKDKIDFHRYLAKLLNLKTNDVVLDLGCGHGNTLMYIMPSIIEGKVIGADIDESLLAVAERILEKDINSGKLELIKSDISKPLKLKPNSITKIVCHNVLECIPNKTEFINRCFTLLKKDGILIISHSDFDTQIYNSSFPELSRELIHNYSDTTQDWMETSDGMIGRKLYGIFHKTKFKEFKSEIYIMQNNKYSPLQYGYRIAQDIIKMALKTNKFKDADIKNWVKDLKTKSANSEYFYSSNINIIIAKK